MAAVVVVVVVVGCDGIGVVLVVALCDEDCKLSADCSDNDVAVAAHLLSVGACNSAEHPLACRMRMHGGS